LAGRCCYATRNLSTAYPQTIEQVNEQLVGSLWINGGLLHEIPHGESRPALYAMNGGSRRMILSKFGMWPWKC
jgi:hypothetical protein